MTQSEVEAMTTRVQQQQMKLAEGWTEHKAPDGRPYYYHAGRRESVWEKPLAVRDAKGKWIAVYDRLVIEENATSTSSILASQMPETNCVYDAMGFLMRPSETAKMKKKLQAKLEKKKKAAKQQDGSQVISSIPVAGTSW